MFLMPIVCTFPDDIPVIDLDHHISIIFWVTDQSYNFSNYVSLGTKDQYLEKLSEMRDTGLDQDTIEGWSIFS